MIRFLLLSLTLCLFAAGCTKKKEEYTILVSAEMPAPDIAARIAEIMQDDFSMTVAPTPPGMTLFEALEAGEGDFAIGEEPAERIEDVRTVVPLYPSILHVISREEFGATNLYEALIGRSVYAGPTDGAAANLLKDFAAELGLGESDYRLLLTPWDEVPDTYFVLGGLITNDTLSSFSGYTMLGFGDPFLLGKGTVAEAMALRHANLRPFVLPEGLYGDLAPEPMLTLTTRTVLAAREDMDAANVRTIARQLFENRSVITQEYPLAQRELTESLDVPSLVLPLHAGTLAHVYRLRPSIWQRWSDPIGTAVGLLAIIASAVVAYNRRLSAMRKDRIDRYFASMFEVRDAIPAASDKAQRGELEKKLRGIQAEVMSLAIKERIEANSALVAFIEMSNQILNELYREADRGVQES